MSQLEYRMAFESFGLVIEVQSDDPALFREVPRVLPPGWRPANGTAPAARFSLSRDGSITLDGAKLTGSHGDRDITLLMFSRAVRYHVAEHAPAHVFVHAGVVAAGGVAVVVPGHSVSGKT